MTKAFKDYVSTREFHSEEEQPSPSDMVDVTYPLRDDLVLFFRLPNDLTKREAERLAEFLTSLPKVEKGPRNLEEKLARLESKLNDLIFKLGGQLCLCEANEICSICSGED